MLPLRALLLVATIVSPTIAAERPTSLAADALPTPSFAASRISTPQVLVSLDRSDWTYACGEPATFTIRVLADGSAVDGAVINYRLGPEKFETLVEAVPVPTAGLVLPAGTMEVPGFLRCIVEYTLDGKSYRGLATAGFAPEAIEATQTAPKDFDDFWQQHLDAMRKVPPRLQKTLVPEACTPEVNVYHVSFESWNFGGRTMPFYGVMTEPTAPGHYPAVLRVPGAGVRPYHGEMALAARGNIVLQMGIHGIPIDLEQPLYDNLRYGALNYYPTFNMDDRDSYYFLRVYLACVRANDVLVAHENWDRKNLVVAGGSQGGQLTIATSALDDRVTGSVANFPAFSDVTGYLHGRAGGWPHLLAKPEHQTDAKINTARYYDTVNFARRLHAPISLGWGYNDETCPVTSLFAVHNSITVEKSLQLHLEMGHRSSPEFNDRYLDRIVAMAHPVATTP
ncbi:acetylxylan esterase [Synoicihabitans lomoniglobus]|uniref:Acetylxylan esterase n=1 Tax=Synoicihabitans lomoniglobus TaxID=2909285 RepID=A0AAF0CSD4_9BACT|nr:acetylxylan esterase [Opitutaceae bacterium LMO-M01]WED67217.1 acetylxylan esterase [Opitutaceae bacterium LMO-M01]